MEQRIRLNLATTAAIVTLGAASSLIASTVLAARAYEQRGVASERRGHTICVKGSTRQRIVSDRAVWSIRVSGAAAQLNEAYSRLEAGVERVQAFLAQQGFAPPEIGLAAIQTATHYTRDAKGQETRDVSGYSLSRSFWIETADVQRVHRTAGRVTELLRDNVLVDSGAPEYHYTGIAALKIELLGAAAKDARSRAEEIARNSRCRVGEVRDAQMGVLQITRPFSTEVSGYGVYDTTSIEKDVQAVVSVTFGVDEE